MSEQTERLSEQLAAAQQGLQDLRKAQQSFHRARSRRTAKPEAAIAAAHKLAQKAEPGLTQLGALLKEITALAQSLTAAQAPAAEAEAIKPEDLARHFRDVVDQAQSSARQPEGDVGVSLKSLDIEVKGLIVVEGDEARLVTPTASRALDVGQLSTLRLTFGTVPFLRAPVDEAQPAPKADLSVAKTAQILSRPARGNWTVAFTILVNNAGPDDATNVVLTDAPDANFTARATGFRTTRGKWTVTTLPKFEAQLGTLKAAESATLSYQAETRPFEIFKSETGVTGDQADQQPGNNQFALQFIAPTDNTEQADLNIKKLGFTSGAGSLSASYVITVTNQGPAVARNVVVTDTPDRRGIAAVSEFTSDPAGEWTQTKLPKLEARLGDLKPGDSVTLKYRARLTPGVAAAINTAEVSSDSPDPTPINNKDSFTLKIS